MTTKFKINENGRVQVNNADDLQNLYLDFVNNFITARAFATYYGMTLDQAEIVIRRGRIVQEAVADIHKLLAG